MHPFGSFCWEFIVWSTAKDIQAIKKRVYIKTIGLFQYLTRTTEWFDIFSRMHFARVLCKEYQCVGLI